jgi:hypothetical protein
VAMKHATENKQTCQEKTAINKNKDIRKERGNRKKNKLREKETITGIYNT